MGSLLSTARLKRSMAQPVAAAMVEGPSSSQQSQENDLLAPIRVERPGWRLELQKGSKVDVYWPSNRRWYSSTVRDVDHTTQWIFLHYDEWSAQWDEWLSIKSDRLRMVADLQAHLGGDLAKSISQSSKRSQEETLAALQGSEDSTYTRFGFGQGIGDIDEEKKEIKRRKISPSEALSIFEGQWLTTGGDDVISVEKGKVFWRPIVSRQSDRLINVNGVWKLKEYDFTPLESETNWLVWRNQISNRRWVWIRPDDEQALLRRKTETSFFRAAENADVDILRTLLTGTRSKYLKLHPKFVVTNSGLPVLHALCIGIVKNNLDATMECLEMLVRHGLDLETICPANVAAYPIPGTPYVHNVTGTQVIDAVIGIKQTLQCGGLSDEFDYEKLDTFIRYLEAQFQKIMSRQPPEIFETETIRCSLLNTWEQALRKHFESDLVLIVKEHEIPAHSFFLTSASPVFKVMLNSQMKESKDRTILIEGCMVHTIKALVQYCETGGLPHKVFDTNENALDLLICADRYDVKELKALCEREIRRRLSTSSVLGWYIHADRLRAETLSKACLSWITSRSCEVRAMESFEEFFNKCPHLAHKVFVALQAGEPAQHIQLDRDDDNQ